MAAHNVHPSQSVSNVRMGIIWCRQNIYVWHRVRKVGFWLMGLGCVLFVCRLVWSVVASTNVHPVYSNTIILANNINVTLSVPSATLQTRLLKLVKNVHKVA